MFLSKCWGKRKELSFLSLPLFFLALVFLDYSVRFVYRFAGATRLLSLKPMLFTLGWSLLLTSLISLLPKIGRRIAMGVLGAFFAFLAVLHGAMFHIFGHFFSFTDMNFAGDGVESFSWSYLNMPKKYLFFIAVFLFMVVLAICLCQRPRPLSRRWIRPAAALGAALVSLVPLFITSYRLTPKDEGVIFTARDCYDPNADEQVYKQFTNPNRCLNLTGLYQYTARNLAISLGWGVDTKSIEELNEFFDLRAQELSGENQYTGLLKDKNLIMIMLESVDTWMLTPDYMPNLYRLQQEGVNFENFYTPLFITAGTFNTEIITLTGLIPPASGGPNDIYSTNSFPISLPQLFVNEGRRVESYHASLGSFYSRGTVHPNLGFAAYNDYKVMNMASSQKDSHMMGGYELFAPEEPFYSFLITFSGHGPYNETLKGIAEPHLEDGKAAIARSGVTGSPENMEEYTQAIAHIMETDLFIGQLIDRLEEDGRMDDTVILLYGDHYGKYMTDTDFLYQVKGVSGPPELYHTPCILYGGGLEGQTVEKYCSTVDIVPTLVNLFDLDVDPKYFMGDDIFGEKGGVVMLPNNAWYDGTTYYNGEGEDPDPELTSKLSRRVTASMDTLRSNYFKSWETD